MTKAIIFDFFDVIVADPYKVWLQKHGYARTGEFRDIVEKMDVGEVSLSDFFKELSRLSGQNLDSVIKEFDTASIADQEMIKLIKDLQGNYKIGLLSNAPSEFIRKLLTDNNLPSLFDEIVISSEVGCMKPSKEIFEIMIEKLQVTPSECIFIDDNIINVDAAKKLGLQGIQFLSAELLRNDLINLKVL